MVHPNGVALDRGNGVEADDTALIRNLAATIVVGWADVLDEMYVSVGEDENTGLDLACRHNCAIRLEIEAASRVVLCRCPSIDFST
jgi:hypothetical protein